MKNPENIYGKDYKTFIKRIFGVADEVCFIVDPFLDNLEELCTTGWEEIYDSALYFDYQELGTGDAGAPQCVKNICEYKYFKHKEDLVASVCAGAIFIALIILYLSTFFD